MAVKEILPEAGGYVVVDDCDRRTFHPIAPVLRAEDIPVGLTYAQVGAISTLANMFAVLIRTLIDKNIIGESFMEDNDYDLDALIETIEDMGGSYHEPDLAVI